MEILKNLKAEIESKIPVARVYELVEPTRSRNGLVLRKLNANGNFNPIVYERGLLAFFIIDGTVTIDKSKRTPLRLNMAVFTDDYSDLALIIESLDAYDLLPCDLSFGSQDIYDRYFEVNNDKPFNGYAFEFSLNTSVNTKEIYAIR